ncbi:PEP-CTERM domain protein [Chitinispirillum alkaliphilum]|nr:PEP-CTERM domain protein [Chitinispirillum alkaliphilum]
MKASRFALLITLIISAAGYSDIIEYRFDGYSGHNPENIATGINQFTMGVEELDDNQVRFIFSNSGDQEAIITRILFKDDFKTLDFDNFEYITVVDGLSFDYIDDPHPQFSFGATSRALSTTPNKPLNGITTGESLGMLFTFTDDNTFNSLINSINNGQFDILLHAQSFSDGGSEQFSLSVPVPEPSTFALLTPGLIILILANYKKIKKFN